MGNCIQKIMSHVLSFSERFSMFLSFISILTCAILCMICMLGFGIGLGYNYSYVDYRAKHNYIQGMYKKVRPTSYYGPGFYKPSTKFAKRPTKKNTYREMRKYLQGEQILDADVTFEPPHDLPFESPVKMLENLNPQENPQVELKFRETEKRLEQMYFNKFTTKARLLSVSLNPQNDSTTDISTDAIVHMHDGKEEEGNALNETNYLSEQEASVTVNVTKTHNDTSPPFIIKTMMHPNHLSKWLSRLRQANKTFAVHVITN